MDHYFTNNNIKSLEHEITFKINKHIFKFVVDYGVFSKKGVDFGTRLLLETLLKEDLNGTFLDVGCGYGVMGIVLNRLKNYDFDMIDINERALTLAIKNAKLNHTNVNIFFSNIYENIIKKYDYIITNPPIRAGKKVVYNIVMNAKKFLNKNGCLYLVVRKQQGAKSLVKDLEKYYQVAIINKVSGYFIIKAKMA